MLNENTHSNDPLYILVLLRNKALHILRTIKSINVSKFAKVFVKVSKKCCFSR